MFIFNLSTNTAFVSLGGVQAGTITVPLRPGCNIQAPIFIVGGTQAVADNLLARCTGYVVDSPTGQNQNQFVLDYNAYEWYIVAGFTLGVIVMSVRALLSSVRSGLRGRDQIDMGN